MKLFDYDCECSFPLATSNNDANGDDDNGTNNGNNKYENESPATMEPSAHTEPVVSHFRSCH